MFNEKELEDMIKLHCGEKLRNHKKLCSECRIKMRRLKYVRDEKDKMWKLYKKGVKS